VKNGKNIYFFANSSNDEVDTWARLKGKIKPELWDPHTGQVTAAEYRHEQESGQPFTRVRLKLKPVRSVLIVEADYQGGAPKN
jgi:hypothetical protein